MCVIDRYQEMFEKRELERLELMSRLALQQPQVDLEAYLRAIRSEISQSVKMAISEAFDKALPQYKEKMVSNEVEGPCLDVERKW